MFYNIFDEASMSGATTKYNTSDCLPIKRRIIYRPFCTKFYTAHISSHEAAASHMAYVQDYIHI